jgi:flagellar biosynthesis/type III secretory pathway protein FliH
LEKQKEQKPEQYDIDVLEKHITKDSVSELAHTVIVRNGWEIVEKEQKPAEWNELQTEFRSINEAFEDGKKEGLEKGLRLGREGMYKEMYCDGVDGVVYRYDKYSYVKEARMDELSEKLNKFNHGAKVKMIILPVKDQK